MQTQRIFTSLVSFALLALHLLTAGPASGASQTGPFQPWNAWWLHPTQATLGIAYDGSAIRIDRDGDGTTESTFVRPTGPEGIPDAAIGSLRLTPSRTIVYSFGGVCPSLGGTLVHFHRVPASGNRLEPIRTNLCIPRGIDRVGFYDTGRCDEPNGIGLGLDCDGRLGISPQRIAYFATASSSFGNENFIWVDLNTGSSSTPTAFEYANGLGFVRVSPSGTQAFIQHSLSVSDSLADYRLVDLCPGSLGTVINAGGFPIVDVDDVLSAEVSAVSAGTVTIAVTPTTPPASFELTDCLDAPGACCGDFGCLGDSFTATQCPSNAGYTFLGAGTACSACPAPPVLEACCFESGEPLCERLTAAACTGQGGDPQTGVSFCAQDTCPIPEPVASIDGPTTAVVGDTVSYSIDWENQGGLTAPDVEIEISLPYGTTFESASAGGVEESGRIVWSLGDVAPGASGSVSFSFSIGCDAANQSAFVQGLISYPYTIEGNRTYLSTNTVQLEIGGVASGPVGVSVASTPVRDPLLPGDTIEHAITLTNANGVAIPGVRLGRANGFTPVPISAGNAAAFTSVADAAGGTADISAGTLGWTGSLPAGGSRTVRVIATVNACLAPGTSTTSLNFGEAVAAFDSCDAPIGESSAPAEIAVQHLVDASIAATNLAPAQNLRAPIIDIDVQVTRPGGVADVTVSLTGAAGQSLPNASISAFVRGFTMTAPPTDPGATWNALARELSWTGAIPASGAAEIHFSGTVSACRAEIDMDGTSSPACTSAPDIRAKSTIAAVPEPPAGAWLAALQQRSHPFEAFSIEEHLVRIDPGPPVTTTTMMCLPAEFYQGIGASPEGDVWVGWLPTFRFNARTLDFQAFDIDRLRAQGLSGLEDVAVDPVDGTVYFGGGYYGPLGERAATILRYDPATDALAPWFTDSSYDTIQSLEVDASGRVAALAYLGAQNVLVRIDPGTPPVASALYDPPASLLTDVAVDRDGSYLTIDGYYGTTPTLFDVDADTGDREAVIADLRVPFPAAIVWGELAVDPAGDLFLAPGQPGLGQVDRATPDVGNVLRPFSGSVGTIADLAMVGVPAPEPRAALAAIAAAAALASLRRARGSTRR